VSVVGVDLRRFDDTVGWERHAEAALAAIGGDDRLRAELENNLGSVRLEQGRYDDALAHYERALALWRALYGEQDATIGAGLNNVGYVYYQQGKLAAAARDRFEAAGPNAAAAANEVEAWLEARGGSDRR